MHQQLLAHFWQHHSQNISNQVRKLVYNNGYQPRSLHAVKGLDDSFVNSVCACVKVCTVCCYLPPVAHAMSARRQH